MRNRCRRLYSGGAGVEEQVQEVVEDLTRLLSLGTGAGGCGVVGGCPGMDVVGGGWIQAGVGPRDLGAGDDLGWRI